jgi:hypothetical protein
MSQFFHEEEYRGYTVALEWDEYADCSPREFDCLGSILAWHPRYSFQDNESVLERAGLTLASPDDHATKEGLLRACGVNPTKDEILPLYLMDHGNIALSVGDFGDPWDSGQVGWVVCPYDKIREEYQLDGIITGDGRLGIGLDLSDFFDTTAPQKRVTAAIRSEVRRIMMSEIQTYSAYVSGDVFSWGVYDREGDDVDSGGTFYDSSNKDETDYAIEQAKERVDEKIDRLQDQAGINIVNMSTGETMPLCG